MDKNIYSCLTIEEIELLSQYCCENEEVMNALIKGIQQLRHRFTPHNWRRKSQDGFASMDETKKVL